MQMLQSLFEIRLSMHITLSACIRSLAWHNLLPFLDLSHCPQDRCLQCGHSPDYANPAVVGSFYLHEIIAAVHLRTWGLHVVAFGRAWAFESWICYTRWSGSIRAPQIFTTTRIITHEVHLTAVSLKRKSYTWVNAPLPSPNTAVF